ncbi:MAG TPA: dihydrofolate reductase [Acidimicrobiia bacterium]|nr:dihydrofolate reductase [Acidimicrobiia bacterium]
MGKVVMYSSVSVDGFVADENDQPGPLFDWLFSGDVPLDESGELKVSQTSYDYTRPYWDQIGPTVVGRHVFDMTDGWDGKPPSGIDHVVVVTHRPQPEGLDPEAPFHFVDGIAAAVVFGSGKRYFGSVDAQHLLEDRDVAMHYRRTR